MGKYFKDPEPIRTSKYFKNDDFNYREAGLLDIGLKGLKYAPEIGQMLRGFARTRGFLPTKSLLSLPKLVTDYLDEGIKKAIGADKEKYFDLLAEAREADKAGNNDMWHDLIKKAADLEEKATKKLNEFLNDFNTKQVAGTVRIRDGKSAFDDDAVEIAGDFLKGKNVERPLDPEGVKSLLKVTSQQGTMLSKIFGFSNKVARNPKVTSIMNKRYVFQDGSGNTVTFTFKRMLTEPGLLDGTLKPSNTNVANELVKDFDELVGTISKIEGNPFKYAALTNLGKIIKNPKLFAGAALGIYGVSKVAPTLVPGTREKIVEEGENKAKQQRELLNVPGPPLTPPAVDPEINVKILEYQKAVRDYESATGDDKEFLKIQKDRLESELISKGIDPMQVSSSSTGVFSNLAPSDEASVLSELLSQTAYFTNLLKTDPSTNNLKLVLERFNTTADNLLSTRQISPNVHAVLKDSGTQLITKIFA